ncbi:hypothetical protein ASG43_08830 [Aureimonas sp. Leaf454]|uniref:DUF1003 domain-containing protein n=1 Tax=Aureimonas sp. Leaf454 TaxID=1736381 RepID=UPI0006F86A05|nr:DUF1003 domain-containing protein [Aureimonas sp. Leaf454]KQT48930.1 hypothetical protein ASG43_08830 [Aureimonas sp. Leaf454]
MATPTVSPPGPDGLSGSLQRNIEVLRRRRETEMASASREEKVAQAITAFTGSMRFVYLHLALYGTWIAVNLGILPIVEPFDPSFVVLAMVASVEAIFLSTFVLISQNRTAAAQDKRADLDLQISLLTEHELTKLTEMVVAIRDHLGITTDVDADIAETMNDVAPEAVLDALSRDETGVDPP